VPGSRHAFNADEVASGDPGTGTQMDALGHFAVLPQAWDGKSEFPSADAKYYGGLTQQQVKPRPDSALQKLGIDKAPPIVTTAVLLDAKTYLGKGKPMEAGTWWAPTSRRCSRRRVSARGLRGRRALHLHRLGRPLERPGH
jgi:hypothetical protein